MVIDFYFSRKFTTDQQQQRRSCMHCLIYMISVVNRLWWNNRILTNAFSSCKYIYIYTHTSVYKWKILEVNDSKKIAFLSHPCKKHSSKRYVLEQRQNDFFFFPPTTIIITSRRTHLRIISKQQTNTIIDVYQWYMTVWWRRSLVVQAVRKCT